MVCIAYHKYDQHTEYWYAQCIYQNIPVFGWISYFVFNSVESSSTAALFSVELTNGLLSESDLVDMNENLSINAPTVPLASVVQTDDMNLFVDASTQILWVIIIIISLYLWFK